MSKRKKQSIHNVINITVDQPENKPSLANRAALSKHFPKDSFLLIGIVQLCEKT